MVPQKLGRMQSLLVLGAGLLVLGWLYVMLIGVRPAIGLPRG